MRRFSNCEIKGEHIFVESKWTFVHLSPFQLLHSVQSAALETFSSEDHLVLKVHTGNHFSQWMWYCIFKANRYFQSSTIFSGRKLFITAAGSLIYLQIKLRSGNISTESFLQNRIDQKKWRRTYFVRADFSTSIHSFTGIRRRRRQ